nr:MAG TPA: hypothetical protein [Caudoviricetes sp.]
MGQASLVSLYLGCAGIKYLILSEASEGLSLSAPYQNHAFL